MDFFYFLVTGSDAWEPNYHWNFFITQGGFLWGIIGALILGVVVACAFYFGCCNSSKTSKYSNVGVWAISLCLCAAISYFYADMVVIGDPKTTDNSSVFRAHSFYKANDDYYLEKSQDKNMTPTFLAELHQLNNKIKSDLDKGGDVRFEFDITTAILAVIFFILASVVVKRFTINGKTIPFERP